MPFISDREKRSVFQSATPNQNIPVSAFGETFDASLGMTIDENLSISGMLNREGWQNRQELVKSKIDEGILDRGRYMDRRGRFDYNRAAVDLNDPAIKTDQTLEKERREMLANRRKNAQDVIDRGSGMAQFLGMANAFMLDPVSIATMPIALPSSTAKFLSIAGRSLLAARNASVIETATELAIQPFVFEHKQDIESPYTYKDALSNIAGAAVGAAALGGIGGGISGYLRKVRTNVEAKGVRTSEVDSALDNIKRMEETLSSNPARKDINQVPISKEAEAILGDVDDIKKIRASILSDAKTKGVSQSVEGFHVAGRAGGDVDVLVKVKDLNDVTDSQFRKIDEFISEFSSRESLALSDGRRVNVSVSDKIDADSVPVDDFVKSDVDFLESLEVERDLVKRPQVDPEQYKTPDKPKASKATTSDREAFILDKEGLVDDFDSDMQRFNELDDPRIVQNDEVVNAGDFMKSIDDELEGIDSVLTCAHG